MPRICVWCGADLEAGDTSKDSEMKGPAGDPLAREAGAGSPGSASEPRPTICRRCADGIAAYRKPVLVVSRDWVRMYDKLVELLKGQPDIQVIVDRRQSPNPDAEATHWDGPDRRKKGQPLIVE